MDIQRCPSQGPACSAAEACSMHCRNRSERQGHRRCRMGHRNSSCFPFAACPLQKGQPANLNLITLIAFAPYAAIETDVLAGLTPRREEVGMPCSCGCECLVERADARGVGEPISGSLSSLSYPQISTTHNFAKAPLPCAQWTQPEIHGFLHSPISVCGSNLVLEPPCSITGADFSTGSSASTGWNNPSLPAEPPEQTLMVSGLEKGGSGCCCIDPGWNHGAKHKSSGNSVTRLTESTRPENSEPPGAWPAGSFGNGHQKIAGSVTPMGHVASYAGMESGPPCSSQWNGCVDSAITTNTASRTLRQTEPARHESWSNSSSTTTACWAAELGRNSGARTPSLVFVSAMSAFGPNQVKANNGFTDDLRKTRMCAKIDTAGGCPLSSEACNFAHSLAELRVSQKFYKMKICAFHEKGKCRNGSQCHFAHGEQDLQVGPDRKPGEHLVPVGVASFKPAASNSTGMVLHAKFPSYPKPCNNCASAKMQHAGPVPQSGSTAFSGSSSGGRSRNRTGAEIYQNADFWRNNDAWLHEQRRRSDKSDPVPSFTDSEHVASLDSSPPPVLDPRREALWLCAPDHQQMRRNSFSTAGAHAGMECQISPRIAFRHVDPLAALTVTAREMRNYRQGLAGNSASVEEPKEMETCYLTQAKRQGKPRSPGFSNDGGRFHLSATLEEGAGDFDLGGKTEPQMFNRDRFSEDLGTLSSDGGALRRSGVGCSPKENPGVDCSTPSSRDDLERRWFEESRYSVGGGLAVLTQSGRCDDCRSAGSRPSSSWSTAITMDSRGKSIETCSSQTTAVPGAAKTSGPNFFASPKKTTVLRIDVQTPTTADLASQWSPESPVDSVLSQGEFSQNPNARGPSTETASFHGSEYDALGITPLPIASDSRDSSVKDAEVALPGIIGKSSRQPHYHSDRFPLRKNAVHPPGVFPVPPGACGLSANDRDSEDGSDSGLLREFIDGAKRSMSEEYMD